MLGANQKQLLRTVYFDKGNPKRGGGMAKVKLRWRQKQLRKVRLCRVALANRKLLEDATTAVVDNHNHQRSAHLL